MVWRLRFYAVTTLFSLTDPEIKMKHHHHRNRKPKKLIPTDSSIIEDRAASTILRSEMPPEVEAEIQAGKAMFEQMLEEGPKDEHYERILATMEEVIAQQDEEQKTLDGYIFNQEEFLDACDHVVADQRSALKKEKINSKEFAIRFNRWFTFCDAVLNLGISCLYSKDALKDKDYEAVFKTLKLNKQFETMFLKPRGLKVELRHKSKMVMEKYPWLAMPVLVINDEQGVEHEIALTPSPNAAVWWLDILSSFHGSYNWVLAPQFDMDDEDDVPTTSIDQPYPDGVQREEEPLSESESKHFGVLSSLATAETKSAPGYRQQPIRAFGESEMRFPIYTPPLDYVREEAAKPIIEPKQSWWKRLWKKVKGWFQ